MKRLILTLSLALGTIACGGDDDEQPPAGNPPPPTLGRQIDRMGRAGVTTALISTFEPSGPRGMARDTYNAAGRDAWSGFAQPIESTIAIIDSLDATCGNQLGAGPMPVAGRYATLAGALADDRLYVNSASGACTLYFGVELDALGVAANMDCGGRTPNYDTIDVTYSALAIGMVSGVGDEIARDDNIHSDSAFPFLAEP